MGELLGGPALEVFDEEIVLKNARVNGVTRDIRIPRTEDGSVLHKRPKKSFYDYRIMSLPEPIRHRVIEKVFAENLSPMASSGFFTVRDGEQNPWELFNLAEGLRAEGGPVKTWLAVRKTFLEAAENFLEGPYEDRYLSAMSNIIDEKKRVDGGPD
jgi:adenylate cyclase